MPVILENPPDNFRGVDIYPTQEEILGSRKFFRKNIIDGGFRNVEEYLDIQFRLLREDFVANLREAIEGYRNKRQVKGLQIYEDIVIRKSLNRRGEQCWKIEVSSEEGDKTFMNGSLLLFTKNRFQQILLGKVVQNLKGVGEVVIEPIDPNLSLNQSYTMAECSQYFDPYYNILSAFKNIFTDKFPMEKYIVFVEKNSVYTPPYLLNNGLSYNIDNHSFVPEMLPRIQKPLLGLNPIQFQAFKAALTQEFVVIQGPPGTGKTHLGIKIASTLIRNAHFWHKETPLLIVSHKNDALDQFLEGLLPITERLVRVGGQSKSDKLKPYNLANEKKNGEWKRRPQFDYLATMKRALVVGMTTSIAARWREYLEDLKSPIVIVEEAAEILEGHVIAALTKHCKHLILMGDHQQLQPLSADHNIGKNYNLGVSLFERMVRNGVQHYQLAIQHRMKPEISQLLKIKIYPFLQDHESVSQRPDIRGVTKNVFFLDHRHNEETVNFTSKKNTFEAKFLVHFAEYLALNGYKKDIVILATYAGQLEEIRPLVDKNPLLTDVKISTLDGFQGQESDVVLLSLVRSAEVGFLGKENRVCVALSRARNGLFIMGNMDLLTRSSKLWQTIRNCLQTQNAVGSKLTLKCQNHGNLTEVQNFKDFLHVKNGGCTIKCNKNLKCDHICSLLCHNEEIKHKCVQGCVDSKENLWQRPTLWNDSDVWQDPDFRQRPVQRYDPNLWRAPAIRTIPRNYHRVESPGIWTMIWNGVKSLWSWLF